MKKGFNMSKAFVGKVLNEVFYDTKNYRYCAMVRHGVYAIYRLPIAWLDTTHSIDGWELLKPLE